MRVLVIDHHLPTADFVIKGLEEAGYAVDCRSDGTSGLFHALSVPFDAVICDAVLPKLDGVSLVRALRAENKTIPILILSEKASVEDRIDGLNAGGDDYMAKPFAIGELLARVRALLRRGAMPAGAAMLAAADLKMDLLKHEVSRAVRSIELQRREFSLLEYLLRSNGRAVTKTMILEHLWDYSFDPQTNVVDVLVYRLRQKIDREFDPKLILTIRGAGYALRVPDVARTRGLEHKCADPQQHL